MLTRVVFVLLAVLNLGVGAWWLVRRAPPPAAVPAEVPGVPLLQIVGAPMTTPPPVAPQTLSPSVEAAPAPVAAVVPTPPVVACARLGPFASNAEAMVARGRLGADVRARVAAQAGRGRGWRVIVPPLADAAAAQAMAARLTQAGFSDNFVMRTGDDANAVALGRFGNEAAARRHAQAVAAAGINAVAEPIGPATWWLEVGAASAAPLAPLQQATGAVSRQPLDCAAFATG